MECMGRMTNAADTSRRKLRGQMPRQELGIRLLGPIPYQASAAKARGRPRLRGGVKAEHRADGNASRSGDKK